MAARIILREVPDDELGMLSTRFDDAWQELEFGFVGASDHITQKTHRSGACYCGVCHRAISTGSRCPVHEDD